MTEQIQIKAAKSGFTFFRVTLASIGILMILVGLYLTDHFYSAFYSMPSMTGVFCDLSAFWNCDTATFSPLAQFSNVPTALFGVFVGLLFLAASAVVSERFERTAYFVAVVNFGGCLGLFVYSLIILKGLCPGCTLYYVASLLAVLLFYMKSLVKPVADLKVSLGLLLVFTFFFFGVRYLTFEQDKNQQAQEESFLKEYYKAPSLEGLKIRSGFFLAQTEGDFYTAPIRISLFSDFQCPVCGYLATKILPKVIKRYEGKIALQYFFYPIDKECHPQVARVIHPYACFAAYLGHCAKTKFLQVHDEIYEHQNELSLDWLAKKATQYGVSECYSHAEGKDSIIDMINIGGQMGVEATPTMIVNERKIEGLIPLKFLFVLLDDIVKKEQNGKL